MPTFPSLNDTFGAVLLGTFLSLMLYGLTVHQTYKYFTMYRPDITLLKTLVITLFLADTAYSVFCIHICYYYLVVNYCQPLALLNGVWSIKLLTPVTAFIITLSQGFYMRRVYLIHPRYIFIVVTAGLFIAVGIGFAIVATVEAYRDKAFDDYVHFVWLFAAGLTSVMITDLLLTGTLIMYLRRSRTSFRRTDSTLNILIVYTINTGLLTGTLNLISLTMAFIYPDSLIYIPFALLSSKSYVNSIMAVLNSRKSLIGSRLTVNEFGTFGMSTGMQRRKQPTRAMLSSWRPSPGRMEVIDIAVSTRVPESPISTNTNTAAGTGDGDDSFQERVFEIADMVGVKDKSAIMC